jgi:hypothetical protein
MLGRVVVEPEQYIKIIGDLRGCFRPLGPELGGEAGRRRLGVGLVFGVIDLRQRRFRGRLRRLGRGVEDVADLVSPAALLFGVGEHVADHGSGFGTKRSQVQIRSPRPCFA